MSPSSRHGESGMPWQMTSLTRRAHALREAVVVERARVGAALDARARARSTSISSVVMPGRTISPARRSTSAAMRAGVAHALDDLGRLDPRLVPPDRTPGLGVRRAARCGRAPARTGLTVPFTTRPSNCLWQRLYLRPLPHQQRSLARAARWERPSPVTSPSRLRQVREPRPRHRRERVLRSVARPDDILKKVALWVAAAPFGAVFCRFRLPRAHISRADRSRLARDGHSPSAEAGHSSSGSRRARGDAADRIGRAQWDRPSSGETGSGRAADAVAGGRRWRPRRWSPVDDDVVGRQRTAARTAQGADARVDRRRAAGDRLRAGRRGVAVERHHHAAALALANDVRRGTALRPSDFVAVDVTSRGLGLVPFSDAAKYVGKVTTVDLSEGAPVTADVVTDVLPLTDGLALVGRRLEPGDYPGAIAVSDRVDIVPLTDAAAVGADAGGGCGVRLDRGHRCRVHDRSGDRRVAHPARRRGRRSRRHPPRFRSRRRTASPRRTRSGSSRWGADRGRHRAHQRQRVARGHHARRRAGPSAWVSSPVVRRS